MSIAFIKSSIQAPTFEKYSLSIVIHSLIYFTVLLIPIPAVHLTSLHLHRTFPGWQIDVQAHDNTYTLAIQYI